MPGTGCPGGSASEGPLTWEVLGFWPPIPAPAASSALSVQAPPHPQPLAGSPWVGWARQGRAELSTRERASLSLPAELELSLPSYQGLRSCADTPCLALWGLVGGSGGSPSLSSSEMVTRAGIGEATWAWTTCHPRQSRSSLVKICEIEGGEAAR